MRKYIHIGYPKNLSTTLQRDFFCKHPQIHHLGVGVGSNIGYVDDEINMICEDYLLYANERKYEEVRDYSKQVITDYMQSVEKQSEHDKQAIGISGELLSFKFSPDHVDSHTKARRLEEIFDTDTTIIMVIRNQMDLLRSLYREVIKIGYPHTFQDFIEYTFYYQDRNFALDFCYDQTVKLYSRLFGKENVKVLPIEEVRADDGSLKKGEQGNTLLIKWLCDALELQFEELELNHHNRPLNGQELQYKMQLNKKRTHDLGRSVYSVVNGHRMASYFNNDLQVPLPKTLHAGLLNKRTSIDEARIAARTHTEELRTIDYYADSFFMDKLKKLYQQSNENLKAFGVSLPHSYDF
ncbi:hypothetical protein [Fodinibius saliphilus]|uniref:hypothetical protein n=1 Tax=Fodinibius saliphilus TaxID=1920650 RepID=UPI0011093861|nr:hypothetical protein [Fodinibius saliphilus]